MLRLSAAAKERIASQHFKIVEHTCLLHMEGWAKTHFNANQVHFRCASKLKFFEFIDLCSNNCSGKIISFGKCPKESVRASINL
jgi:hypothetical protein